MFSRDGLLILILGVIIAGPARVVRGLFRAGIRIIAHLADVELTVFVEGRGDRIVDHRLRRHQFEMEAARGLESLQRLRRSLARLGN